MTALFLGSSANTARADDKSAERLAVQLRQEKRRTGVAPGLTKYRELLRETDVKLENRDMPGLWRGLKELQRPSISANDLGELIAAKRDSIVDIRFRCRHIIPAGTFVANHVDGLDYRQPALAAIEKPAADDGPRKPGNAAVEAVATDARESYLKLAGKSAGQKRDDNRLKMELLWCLPGSFKMGEPMTIAKQIVVQPDQAADDDDDPAEKPVEKTVVLQKISPVEVSFLRGYCLGKFEVTQAQWRQLMATEPWKGQKSVGEGDDFPATFVDWPAATAFCRKLTDEERKAGRLPEGWEYALPTEAQWERACRARTETRYSFGDDDAQLGEYGYFSANTFDTDELYARRVGQLKPNPWGFYDMHGNVWEWCRDTYEPRLPGGMAPEVKTRSGYFVIRGGSWVNTAELCRSRYRYRFSPASHDHYLGFRVALVTTANK